MWYSCITNGKTLIPLMLNDKKKYTFFVETGNWKAKINIYTEDDPNDHEENYLYIEAGTRAMETVFGSRDHDEDNELVSLLDDNDKDYYDEDPEMAEVPPPVFGIMTRVYQETDKKHFSINTSVLFRNASQNENVKYAMDAEAWFANEMSKLKNKSSKKKTKKTKKIKRSSKK